MTIDELEAILNSTSWVPLGEGTYNRVTLSQSELTINGFTGKWVLKRPINAKEVGFNSSPRAVRKWNLLNPDYPAMLSKHGWIAPYLGNTPASDEQIALKLIDIYARTNNIVGDAVAKGPNFIVYNGDVVCIDVDHAYSRTSLGSKGIGIYTVGYYNFLASCEKSGYRESVKTIKTLLYVDKHLVIDRGNDTSWIRPDIITILHGFREKCAPITPAFLDKMLKIMTFISVEDSYFKQITPQCICFLQIHLGKQSLTLDIFRRFLQEYLLSLYSIEDWVRSGCLDELDILVTYDNALIHLINPQGYGLLHIAVISQAMDVMMYLIKAGIDLNATVLKGADMGLTALDLACSFNHDKITLALFNTGARFSPYQVGKTHIIHILARNGLLDEVKKILELHPELLSARDEFHNTPLQWAESIKHRELVSFLTAKSPKTPAIPFYTGSPSPLMFNPVLIDEDDVILGAKNTHSA